MAGADVMKGGAEVVVAMRLQDVDLARLLL